MKNIFNDIIFFIPARKNSKGLPFKNRKLFDFTASVIPTNFKKNVFVSTDDEQIKLLTKKYEFNLIDRPEEISQDETSTKEVLLHFIKQCHLENKIIVLLYLTYPERTWSNIQKIIEYYCNINDQNSSILCKKQITSHPYLMMYELENNKGKQLIKHNLYRRQDYPNCFEISHFVAIFNSNIVEQLNENLYNDNTFFYPINDVIDVDYQKDLEKYAGKNNS